MKLFASSFSRNPFFFLLPLRTQILPYPLVHFHRDWAEGCSNISILRLAESSSKQVCSSNKRKWKS